MTTKEYLSQISRLKIEMQDKLAEIAELDELVKSIRGIKNEEKVQTTPNQDPLGTAMAELLDMEQEFVELIRIWRKKKETIEKQIKSITNKTYFKILYSAYISDKSFESIATETNYAYKYIVRAHGDALKEFESKFGQSYLS